MSKPKTRQVLAPSDADDDAGLEGLTANLKTTEIDWAQIEKVTAEAMRDDVDRLELAEKDLEDPTLLADLEAIKGEGETGEAASSAPAAPPVRRATVAGSSDVSHSVSPPAAALSSFPTLSANRKQGFFDDFIVAPRPSAPVARSTSSVSATNAAAHDRTAHAADESLSAEEEHELRLLQGEASGHAVPTEDGPASEQEVAERLLQWKRRWRDCKASNAPAGEVTAALRHIKKLQSLSGQSALRSALPPAPPLSPQPTAQLMPAASAASAVVPRKPSPQPTVATSKAAGKAAPTTVSKPARAPALAATPSPVSKAPVKTAKRAAAQAPAPVPAALSDADEDADTGEVEELVSAPMRRAELVDKLRAQIESLHDKALSLKNSGDKQAAIQMYRLQKDAMAHYQAFVSLLTHAPEGVGLESEGCLLTQTRYVTSEHSNPRLDEDELEISIVSAHNLALPSGYSTLSTYAVLMFPFPSETQPIRIATPIVANSRSPEWKHVARVRMDRKKFAKWVQRRVLTVDIMHSRWLFADVLVGRVEVKLAPLLTTASHSESVPVLDGRRVTGGSLRVALAVRVPLQGRHIRREPVTFLLPHLPSMPSLLRLQQQQQQKEAASAGVSSPPTPSTAQSPSRPLSPEPAVAKPLPAVKPTAVEPPVEAARTSSPTPAAAPPPASAAASPAPSVPTTTASVGAAPPVAASSETASSAITPASSKPAAKPAPKPAATGTNVAASGDEDLEDLANNVDLLASNNVLEWEIETTRKEVESLRAKRAAIPEVLEDRLQHLELKMQLLIISVQTGQLTMEAYVAQLNTKIADDRKLAARLTKAGKKDLAKKVLMRVKIMQNELAESAGDGDASASAAQ